MAKNLKIPENYQTVMPYLIVKDAAQFICLCKLFSMPQKHTKQ